MRPDIKIAAIFLCLNTLAVNGTLYKLIVNNCEGETTTKLISMLVITILISFGLAFLLQKLGVRFGMKGKVNQNPEK
jgi:hypothetical protein